MTLRQAFGQNTAGAMAAIAFTGCDLVSAARTRARAQARPTARGRGRARPAAKRREAMVAGQRRHLAAEVGSSQLVVGTDHPIPWQAKAVDHILEAPGFTDAERRAMLGETAAGLLGIKL